MSVSAISIAKVPRSVFDLTHSKKFSAEMGLIYPVMAFETQPGGRYSVGYEGVFRASPLAAPLLHRIDVRYAMFYCPYRILHGLQGADQEDWINFITGGEDGDDATTLPTWNPSAAAKRNAGTLWDMLFGFQGITPDADSLPLDYWRRAYFLIFNEWFRDVAVEPEIDWSIAVGSNLDVDGNALPTGYNDDENMQFAGWDKDYFSAARPSQQLGDPVSLSIGSATWDSSTFVDSGTFTTPNTVYVESNDAVTPEMGTAVANGITNMMNAFNDNTIASVDISELRLAFQVQKWQELNMRAGVRYPEWSKSQFGVDIRDSRIQIPEYCGSARQPVVVSDIEYTAEGAADPVGTLTGKGTSIKGNFLGKVFSPEFGVLMVLMWIRPKAAYHQGIHRSLTRRTRWDFYNPLFANLSEQAILQRELYVTAVANDNETVFGYSPIWDEYRVMNDTVHGLLAPGQSYDYWHAGRTFSAAPTLSASFIRMHDINDDAWAVPAQPHFFVHHQNQVKAVLPMPYISTPGNADR